MTTSPGVMDLQVTRHSVCVYAHVPSDIMPDVLFKMYRRFEEAAQNAWDKWVHPDERVKEAARELIATPRSG